LSFFDYPTETPVPLSDPDYFLPDASDEEWARLLEHTRPRWFSAGDAVISAGARDRSLYLVLDGVLERYPDLRGGVIEIGAGWVPDMIRRLDHAAEIWSKSEPHLREMKRKPSEQIRAQLRFTPYPFEDVGAFVRESCEDLYLFSSDYPHAEGGRDPIGRFDRSTAALSTAAKAKFFSENFRVLYPNAFANGRYV